MTAAVTRTLPVPGATLTYDLRAGTGDGSDDAGVLFLVGSPMDADGFVTLASHFTDRTVLTYDPRGVSRSTRDDDTTEATPQEHAEDLRSIVEAVGAAGAVDIFASSGGAVNALALVAGHPGLVRTLVAHEPPAAQVLPDREPALAACADIHTTYLREGFGPAMAKFIALTGRKGQVPANWADEPGPSAADFGLPAEDDGSRNDPLVGQNIRACTGYAPDFDALRAAPTRIVLAVGRESEGELAARAAVAVAAGLGIEPTWFPSHHGGFLGGEFGQHGAPEEFAKQLRQVLGAANR